MNPNMNAELKQTSPADGLAPVYAQYPIEVVGADGVWLHTRNGRKVLDLYGGHAVASLGYGHKGWTKALTDQAAQMNFQTNAVPMEVRARAAHKLLNFSKLPFDSVFWINSGAEANENAFKMAFKMRPGRTHVAAVEQSFHGRTAACASTTWQAPQKWFFLPRAPFDVSWIKRRDVGDIPNHVTEKTAAGGLDHVERDRPRHQQHANRCGRARPQAPREATTLQALRHASVDRHSAPSAPSVAVISRSSRN